MMGARLVFRINYKANFFSEEALFVRLYIDLYHSVAGNQLLLLNLVE